ncbi:Phostensin like [Actinidia chinensis var. chinensis]|uniref:Phostensin like n=1 Tax=Actinidia chinensis var. chinensis TaxID=1590841 RepID=A0A2R6PRZ9_ACTCC|nr:Phostensin like [Actinidia chinensis var. chinensis]
MPGPGPHLMYALGTGQALTSVSNGRFGPHHCLTYALNAFFGPDLGSFSEWLASTLGLGQTFASYVEHLVHHPFYYVLVLGLPLSLLYSCVSKVLIRRGFLDSVSGVPLTRRQCLLLVSAGSLTHFFLDHLFEENGHSSMYTWILSTGWWESRAPVNPDAVIVVGCLCTCLISGFIYINRVKPLKSIRKQSNESMRLILFIASLYCLWCASQIYLVNPRRAPVGEEADLGVLVFLGIYFFLPHALCIMSMNPKDYVGMGEQLPL